MRNLFFVLCLSASIFCQQPADVEAALDGLGIEQSCASFASQPIFIHSSFSPVSFDFDIVTGTTADYFDLFATFGQVCVPVVSQPSPYGSIDLDISSPGFFYVLGGVPTSFNGAFWTVPVTIPVSSFGSGDTYMLQALVVDATHPNGARLTNALGLFN